MGFHLLVKQQHELANLGSQFGVGRSLPDDHHFGSALGIDNGGLPNQCHEFVQLDSVLLEVGCGR
ncbi:MAG TPA: hypothetical protein VLA12_11620, partial [Planctomycetaceae bacterium]|nr:hypothetical protein [Planctomycetaceae bacterium]